MNRRIYILVVAALLSAQAFAQQDKTDISQAVVTVGIDKKVIEVEKLNLPPGTPIKDILALLPELVNRKGEYIANNYDVQVNGISVNNAQDAALSQIEIADVKCVEVSENSLSSIMNYGQGGSINIVLKGDKEGTSGTVMADASYEPDYMGGFLFKHKNKKWTLNVIGNLEVYQPTIYRTDIIVDEQKQTMDEKERFFSESTIVDAKYKASEHDEFGFSISQNLLSENDLTRTYQNYSTNNEYNRARMKNMYLDLSARYSHLFRNQSKLSVTTKYAYTPDTAKDTIINAGDEDGIFAMAADDNVKAHSLMEQLEYDIPLIKSTDYKALNLQVGMQSTFRFSNNEVNRHLIGFDDDWNIKTNERNYFLRPYAVLQGRVGKMSFKGQLDFQHYHYMIGEDNVGEINTEQNDFTGMANALWKVRGNDALRFGYYHSINRPSGVQLFPYLIFNPSSRSITFGNPELKPVKSDVVGMDYMLNLSNKDRTLTFTFGVYQNLIHDLIIDGELIVDDVAATTYVNDGKYNVSRANLMAFYSKGIFSFSMTSNLFYAHEHISTLTTDFVHFNISATPSLNFKSGWMTSASIYYNSRIKTNSFELGDFCYGSVRVGKTWGHWNVHLFGLTNFIEKGVDTVYENGVPTAIKNYDYMKFEVGAGVRYDF